MNFLIKIAAIYMVISVLAKVTSLFGASNEPDSLLRRLQQMQNDDSTKVYLLIDLCWTYNQSDPARALEYGHEAADLARKLKLDRSEGLSLNAVGVVHYYLSDYATSLDYFFQVVDIYKQLPDVQRLVSAYTNIGNCLEKLTRFEEALSFQELALDMLPEKDQYVSLKASVLNNIGNLYIGMDQYDTALTYHQRSLEMKQTIDEAERIPYSLGNIGRCYMKLEKYDQAISYLTESYLLLESADQLAELVNTAIDLGIIYTTIRNYTEASTYLKNAMTTANRIGYTNGEMLAYKAAGELYDSSGDIYKAYSMFKVYHRLSQELFNEQSNRQILELTTRFEIKQRDEKLDTMAIQMEQEKKLLYASIIVTFISIIVIVLVVFNYRLRAKYHRKREALLKMQKEQQVAALENKSRELLTANLGFQHKQELLSDISNKLTRLIKKEEYQDCKEIRELKSLVNHNLNFDLAWDDFKLHFESVHPHFFMNLQKKYTDITDNELKLCAYMKLNLSTKEIARMLNISDKSVQMARYRLKKRMGIPQKGDLREVIQSS